MWPVDAFFLFGHEALVGKLLYRYSALPDMFIMRYNSRLATAAVV